MNSSVKH